MSGFLCVFVSSCLLELQLLKLCSGSRLVQRTLHSVPVVDLPALEFVQQRLITDVQTPRGLFAIPTGLFEDTQNQLFFSLFGGSRSNVLERHVVFFRFHWNRDGIRLHLL